MCELNKKGTMLRSCNPATGEIVATYPFMSDAEVEQCVVSARTAFLQWRSSQFSERRTLMLRLAHVLRQYKQAASEMMTIEMGKPIAQSLAEVEKCAWCCEYFATNAEEMLAPLTIPTEYSESGVYFQPMGVLFAIMPWNFPFWQVFRCVAPALMAGNTVVVKHSPEVTGCALMIQEIIRNAGFPDGTYTAVLATHQQAANIIAHQHISAVTFTGSTRAGKTVAAITGANAKKCVLELGGSDPYIILDDADLRFAAETCVQARIVNSGQSCVAAKRFIVMSNIRHQFEELFVEFMQSKVVGNPLDSATHIGPLARTDLRDTLWQQTTQSIANGATVLLQGGPTERGAYFTPMVLTDVQQSMAAYSQELFGPVAAIIPVATEEDAIHVANDSDYGLGSAVFTSDTVRGKRVALALDTGVCAVNDFVKSDPRLPFGGVKDSGFGRELSVFGIREFVTVKTLCVA